MKLETESAVIYAYLFISIFVLLTITLVALFGSYAYLSSTQMDKNSIPPVSAFVALLAFLVGHRLFVNNILAKSMQKKLEEIENHVTIVNN